MLGFHKDSGGPNRPDSAKTGAESAPTRRSGETPSKRLGEILIGEGLINDLALEEALAEQEKKGGFIGQILVEKGFAKQSDILLSLVRQCKIPHLSLLDYDINKEALKLIPKEICFRYTVLPIDKLGRILTVAMVNPLDDEALAEIGQVCPDLRIKPILCDWEHFQTVASREFNEPKSAKTGAYDHLRGPAPAAKPPASKPAAAPKPAPPPEDPALQAAMNEAVSEVIKSASAEGAAPEPPEPTKQAPEKTSVSRQESAPATVDAQNLVASLRDGITGALQEALSPLVKQLGATTAASQAAPDDLSDTLRTAVRDALRENEAAAVARANLHDLETRDQERNKRRRHASVNTFGAQKHNAMEVLQNPEFREESDQRVAAAMDSDRLLEGYTFDGFIVGSANAFTHKICRAVAEHPGADYNPLFVYGDVGLGKTHLITATGNAILAGSPNARVGFVSASRFSTHLMEALNEGAVKVFRENYCHWDVLILDDIQFLGGRVEAQEEFFHIFNVLQQEGRQIIIAGDKPPDRLGMLEQRLVSRFAGGIVVNLKPPEFETRVAILQRAAKSGTAVDDEVLSLIAMRVSTDIRKMLGALRKIQAFAELEKKDVSCELAGEILSHLGFDEAA